MQAVSRSEATLRCVVDLLKLSQCALKMTCLICDCDLDGEATKISQSGLNTLKAASTRRQDGLHEAFENATNLRLHAQCRKDYTRETSIAKIEKLARNGELQASI